MHYDVSQLYTTAIVGVPRCVIHLSMIQLVRIIDNSMHVSDKNYESGKHQKVVYCLKY